MRAQPWPVGMKSIDNRHLLAFYYFYLFYLCFIHYFDFMAR